MDKLKMQSADITAQNIAKLADLFPSVITEAKNADVSLKQAVDFEKLREILADEIAEGRETYEFTWVGKREAMVEAARPIRKTLRPCKEESKDWETTQNLYIEGDNLDVLKLLQESYLNKVKMIYIDPPYNTGNDFIYRDDFAMSREEYEEEQEVYDDDGNRLFKNTDTNGRFHSDWCSMIYPRLQLARNLLTDDGVIFISIDDNEVTNLRKICDEVFGKDKFIEQIIWKNKYGAGAKTVGFISIHEYILCYSKKPITELTSELDEDGQARFNKKDDKFSVRGGYMTQPLMTNSLGDRPNLMYELEYKGVKIIPNKQWVWAKDRMMQAIQNDEVEFNLQKDGSYSVRSKSYLIDENGNMRRSKPITIYNGPFTQDGTKELKELFKNKIIFDFSKPSELIKKFLSLEINEQSGTNDIILDFFSGSATTAHAVMQLNAEDGGNRKFIMVQLPEKTDKKSEAYKAGYANICEIGKERIRRAGAKIKAEVEEDGKQLKLGQEPKTMPDIGFRVLKLDDTNMQDVYYAPADYKQEQLDMFASNIKSGRDDMDLLYGCMLDWGLMLSLPHITENIDGATVHTVNHGDLIACFADNVPEAVIREIAARKPLKAVFRDSSFADSPAKINVGEIFKALSPNTDVKVI